MKEALQPFANYLKRICKLGKGSFNVALQYARASRAHQSKVFLSSRNPPLQVGMINDGKARTCGWVTYGVVRRHSVWVVTF